MFLSCSSGFVEDALVVGLAGGADVVEAEFFLGVDAGDFAQHAGGRAWRERRGPSTAQPNHLTGSEMGRKSWVAPVGMTGRAD